MSEAHANHDDHGPGVHAHEPHPPIYYIKIWALLLVLLCISIAGPMLGNKVLTVITAFGIAVVKALIVAAFFMHLNVEKKYIWYVLLTMLGAVAIFFFGVSADVMKYKGSNWTKPESYKYEQEFKKTFADHEDGKDEDKKDDNKEGAPAAAAPAEGAAK